MLLTEISKLKFSESLFLIFRNAVDIYKKLKLVSSQKMRKETSTSSTNRN